MITGSRLRAGLPLDRPVSDADADADDGAVWLIDDFCCED